VPQNSVGHPPSNSEDAPRRVGSFEILGEIGRGGMGIVYRARDTQLGRVVALKRPKRDALAQPDFRKRFTNEARTASKVMHPHITTVFEVFEHDEVPWLVMELVDGASLSSMIGDDDPLSCEEVLNHAEGLTDALRVAHAGGVLHLDINPNNILIGKDGRARLTDFGLARAWIDPAINGSTSDVSTDSHSSTTSIAGTRGYMSPEQALGKEMDPRSDIFSLGAVLYEMCTGRPAFYNPETGEWLDALLHREPQSISRVNHDIPIEFEDIVRKAVAKRTFQRYQSANEMLLDLRAVRRKIESESGYSVPSFDERPRRRGWWIAGAVVAVTAIAAGFLVKAVLDALNRFPTLSPDHRRLVAGAGWDGQPVVSPDGTMVAFTSNASGNLDIWVTLTEVGEPLQLTNEPSAESNPSWFPGRNLIVYESDAGGTPSIWQIPPLGGSAVELLTNAGDPAISPDGTHIAFVRTDSAGLTRIAVAPLDDPTRARVLTGNDDGLWDHTSPAWSPDGRTICYAGSKNLWLVSADGGEATRLTHTGTADQNPVWSPDGRFIFFSSFRDQILSLWCMRIADGSVRRLTAGTSDEDQPSLSGDGRLLAYSVSHTNPDIEVLDRKTGLRTRILGGADEEYPVMAPDASSVAFSSDQLGTYDLWLQPLDGTLLVGPPRRLTDHPGSAAVPAFSPDGRWLAYHRIVDGRRDIWIVPTVGGTPQRITDHPANDIHPAFSPDGSTLAFVSDRNGVDHVWLASIGEGWRLGEPRQLTRGSSSHLFPLWSPDGNRIACMIERDNTDDIAVFDIRLEAEPVFVSTGANATRLQWSSAGDELLVSASWGTDQVSLKFVSIRDGSTRPFEPALDLGPADLETHNFSWDAAGRIVAYEVSEKKGEVWLTETDLGRRWGAPWR